MHFPGPPVDEELFELDSEPVRQADDMGQSDENDETLAQVLERSRYDVQQPLQRTNTGTDEEELEKALLLSLQVQ